MKTKITKEEVEAFLTHLGFSLDENVNYKKSIIGLKVVMYLGDKTVIRDNQPYAGSPIYIKPDGTVDLYYKKYNKKEEDGLQIEGQNSFPTQILCEIKKADLTKEFNEYFKE